MKFIPEFSISVANAFWFSILFILTNIIVLKLYPSHYKKRVLVMPKFKDKQQQRISTLNFFLFQGLVGLVMFLPIRFNPPFFSIGITIFIIGYIAYVTSLINYATNDPCVPVTKGIYKISRNPMQITTIIMWVGLGFATGSLLVITICTIQLITVYPTFKAQETFCINKYGDPYREYMKKTPRYFFGL